MQVAVTGSSGLVGSAVCAALRAAGHGVVPVVRRGAAPGEASWDPDRGSVDTAALAGIDAVVHLAGVGIGDRRWTRARRAELVRSRVEATVLLSGALKALEPLPKVLVSASAVGVYGDRGDEVLTEQSTVGTGFLAELCRDWEAATAPAAEAGIRVVTARSGIVLAKDGGALARQLPIFRAGLGGRLGSGRQWTSWVSIDDEVRAILFALEHTQLRGPMNVTAPTPVTNRDFTTALAAALRRPAVLAVPKPALALALGPGITDEMILASQRALPTALQSASFEFVYPQLDGALSALLQRRG
jgi:uncharacterized protein (TIGR01777 family)